MPELPEIETIKQELEKLIKNKKIKSVDVNLKKQVKPPLKKFLKIVTGAEIRKIKRRAKTLIFTLDNNKHLVFHLKMTGQLIYKGKKGKLAGGGHPIKQQLDNLPNKYSHIIFNFTDSSKLFFNDTRQFGWVKVVTADELERINNNFGPEPLDINFEKFKKLFNKKSKPIKPLLMDQSLLAGIGNIYAQEACFCAGVRPTKPSGKISDKQLKKLFNCLQKILKLAILKKGTSANNYIDAFGRKGSMQPYLKVYGRAGKKCKKCKKILKQIKQGGRTTVYCPNCQK